jgi:hypothetical protein
MRAGRCVEGDRATPATALPRWSPVIGGRSLAELPGGCEACSGSLLGLGAPHPDSTAPEARHQDRPLAPRGARLRHRILDRG